jgi:hypothetical protein
MTTSQPARTERPRFYEQQYLGARDLTGVVQYARKSRARHDLGAHIWGIAAGLQIVEKPSQCGGPLEVYLEPGYAWDGFGRPITVLAPVRVSPGLFDSLTFEASDGNTPPGRLVPLWIRYRESAVGGPPPGFEICSNDDQYCRTWETYQLVAGHMIEHYQRHDPVGVAGYAIDAREVSDKLGIPGPTIAGVATHATLEDESVAYQSFPTKDTSRWLVPLGVVRWLPPNGAAAGGFQQRVESADPDLTVGPRDLTDNERRRRYIGVVAGTVNAAGKAIRLRSRDSAFDPQVWSNELVWVEGSARVAGDVTLLDGKLSFRDARYDDHQVPLKISRIELNALGGRDLLEQIGAAETGFNRLVVGPIVGTTVKEKFVVTDNGKVGVGEPKPDRPLVVRAQGANEDVIGLEAAAGATKWAIALKTNGVDGLHIRETVPDATRVFVKEGGDVGIGTTAPTHNLHVSGSRGIRQNELYMSGGFHGQAGSSFTFNAHRNASNTDWVFPNPSHSAVTVEVDDWNGTPRFEVWSTTVANKASWNQRLHLNGDTGDFAVAHTGGKAGIGILQPACKLHVAGSISGSASDITQHVAMIENTAPDNNASVLALKVATANLFSGKNFITFFAGGSAVGAIESNWLGNGIFWHTPGADVAEWMPRMDGEPKMSAGDVVGVHEGRVSRRIDGAERIMVVSTAPMVLGNQPPDDQRAGFEPMVLIGRAPIRVRGPVARGDFILAGRNDDGVAIAASPDSVAMSDLPRIVAVAWEDADGPDVHAVHSGVGLAPGSHVWSLVAAEIARLHSEPKRPSRAPKPRRSIKKKKSRA